MHEFSGKPHNSGAQNGERMTGYIHAPAYRHSVGAGVIDSVSMEIHGSSNSDDLRMSNQTTIWPTLLT
jgi:hypothetical protein